MNLPRKILTALRLLGRQDFATLRRQWEFNKGLFILRRHGAAPFVHQRLGFPSVCHPGWTDSAELFCLNAGDHWEYQLLAKWLEPGDQFLDLGTNLGYYAFAALPAVGPSGLVVAVDAAPFVIEKLRLSAGLLGAANLRGVQAAVTDESGEVSFYVCPAGFITGEQSLRPPDSLLGQSVRITVPACTLLELQRAQALDARLNAVKVDIEGAEGAALRAAPPEWFTADGPLWIVEINPGALARFGVTAREILARFPPAQFDCWLLPKHPHDPKARPTLRPAGRADPFADSLYYNLFALPRGDGRRARVRRLAAFFPDSTLTRVA
ncbi:MAG: FkbM family methyltransferase [Opitutae bacterium]|nr:FkbM family methyltransferase [Opitutae bacterium]